MRILLEDEHGNGKWQMNMVPTTAEEEKLGMPTQLDLGVTLLGIANNLLRGVRAEIAKQRSAQPQSNVIQLPQGAGEALLRNLDQKKK